MQDRPHRIRTGDDGLLQALAVIDGGASRHLPVVYLSALGQGRWALPEPEIEKLARDLSGVAHVMVEPTREFSFALRDVSAGRNAYGGTIGIAVPGRGFVRRLFLGWAISDTATLAQEVRATALDLRTQMGKTGVWDWLDLQDAVLRHQRDREKNRLTAEETTSLYDAELATKDERIAELEAALAEFRDRAEAGPVAIVSGGGLAQSIGPELYDGEFNDRLRAALTDIVARGADQGWDSRSLALFGKALESLPPSAGLAELREDLRRATKDSGKLASAVPALLARHGYQRKADNKHIRLEPQDGFVGLNAVTVPKTPSDHRTGDNLRGQIEGSMGLKRL